MQQSCFTCDFRPDRVFCDMPAESLPVLRRDQVAGNLPAEHNPILRRTAGSGHLSAVRRPGQTLHLLRQRQATHLAGCGPRRSSGLGCRSVQYALRNYGRTVGRIANRVHSQKRIDEVPAGEFQRLHAGGTHAQPGPARSLRTRPYDWHREKPASPGDRSTARPARMSFAFLHFGPADPCGPFLYRDCREISCWRPGFGHLSRVESSPSCVGIWSLLVVKISRNRSLVTSTS